MESTVQGVMVTTPQLCGGRVDRKRTVWASLSSGHLSRFGSPNPERLVGSDHLPSIQSARFSAVEHLHGPRRRWRLLVCAAHEPTLQAQKALSICLPKSTTGPVQREDGGILKQKCRGPLRTTGIVYTLVASLLLVVMASNLIAMAST